MTNREWLEKNLTEEQRAKYKEEFIKANEDFGGEAIYEDWLDEEYEEDEE